MLVGHSYGGLYTQMYAARYPDETAGVALIDSSHPEQFSRLPEAQENYEQTKRLFAVAPLLARLGVFRLFDVNPAHPDLPPQQRAQIEAFNSSTRHLGTTTEEFRATPETSAQVRSTGSLADTPLAVISAGEQSPAWLELQDELATHSSNRSHRIVDGATHVSLLYDPSDAHVTSAAIVEVVEAERNDQPLARQNP